MTEILRNVGKKSGAWLVRYALEQLPVSHTFGIPGVHNTEIYDELSKSEKIQPILVTHEAGAAFMGDAVSRTTPGKIGTLVVVPAAGVTHAMSGIGEAFLDGIPLLVISGGTRTDVSFGFQLHELDQLKLVAGVTKGAWRITSHSEIVPRIFEAYHLAMSGMPGPVLIEIPANILLFQGLVEPCNGFEPFTPEALTKATDEPIARLLDEAVTLLSSARAPGLFVGWGAVDVADALVKIADLLGAPVATTLQGLSAFPGNHPLHTGMGFSRAAVPAAFNAFKDCDCMLAIGTRFGEIPTGSFGCVVPENLIHIDVDPQALNRNYKAKVAITGDARVIVPMLLERLISRRPEAAERRGRIAKAIAQDKESYRHEWLQHQTDRVNPARFFKTLRERLDDNAIVVVDDGNHTFLAAELFENRTPRHFISPTDFNCMGYCVPAAIGAKLANPARQVVGIVGDGAFLMTGLETLTATTEGLGVVYFIFYDGELSQISQGQQIPYNRKTCTVLGQIRIEGIAIATGAMYLAIADDSQIEAGIEAALLASQKGQPVIVDVRIDYSKKTRFTQGVVPSVFKRFPLGDKIRFIGRSMVRKITG